MNCCDDAGRCTGQQNCAIRPADTQAPVREHTTRRYRAGQPAEIPMPTMPIDYAGQEPEPDGRVTTLDLVMGGACIVLCLFIVAVVLDTVGWL